MIHDTVNYLLDSQKWRILADFNWGATTTIDSKVMDEKVSIDALNIVNSNFLS